MDIRTTYFSSYLSLLILLCCHMNNGICQSSPQPFTLFHPVPDSLMREMTPDRPDKTESPVTVDAGHFMYETAIAQYERSATDDGTTKQLLINEATLKLGLSNSTDIQLIVQSFGQETKAQTLSNKEKRQGFGDLTVRIKQHLYGADKDAVALAVMGYLKFPTTTFSTNKSYEGGIMVPVEIKLPHEWKLGLQIEGDRLKDDEGNNFHTEIFQSLVLSHSIFKKLEASAETYYTYDFKGHEWSNFLNAALLFEVNKNFKLDAGTYHGIQRGTETSYFLGASFRL